MQKQTELKIPDICTLSAAFPVKHCDAHFPSTNLPEQLMIRVLHVKSQSAKTQQKGFPGLSALRHRKQCSSCKLKSLHCAYLHYSSYCIAKYEIQSPSLYYVFRWGMLYLLICASWGHYSPKNKTDIRDEKRFLYLTVLYTCKWICLQAEIAYRQDEFKKSGVDRFLIYYYMALIFMQNKPCWVFNSPRFTLGKRQISFQAQVNCT